MQVANIWLAHPATQVKVWTATSICYTVQEGPALYSVTLAWRKLSSKTGMRFVSNLSAWPECCYYSIINK